MQELAPYELSPDVVQALIDVAVTSDVLLFGELHGTQEVPRLLVRLLDDLAAVGYRGLALEIPRDERDALERWARVESTTVPEFFAHPFADGRGNRQVLSLVHQVLAPDRHWHLLCFDLGLRPLPRTGTIGQSVDHSLELLLPHATPATFLASPRQLPIFASTRH